MFVSPFHGPKAQLKKKTRGTSWGEGFDLTSGPQYHPVCSLAECRTQINSPGTPPAASGFPRSILPGISHESMGSGGKSPKMKGNKYWRYTPEN